MPFFLVENGGKAEVPVDATGGLRLTVSTDRNQPACTVRLLSGSGRVLELVSNAGLLVDDFELDPEVVGIEVEPTAGGPTPMFITLHASRR